MKKVNFKPIAYSLLLVGLLCVIGYTVAYYTSSDTFNNEFNAGTYKMVVQETFQSPDNWAPGDTTPKTVTATNKGNTPAAVRIKLTPSWVDANGDPLDLVDEDDNEVALINFADGYDGDWIYSNGYYYYNGSLGPNEVTSSLLESVTFNGDANIESDKTCTEDPTTHKTKCVTKATGYAGGKYTLKVDVETVQFDKYQEVWGTTIEMDEQISEPEKLYDIVQNKAKMDNVSSTYVSSSSGINYGQKSSDTNGKGVYTISSTANDTYPITFYRGDVKNNNVAFADQCWKILRTTDTGGTKLVYNGNAIKYYNGLSQSDYNVTSNTIPLTYDPITTLWKGVFTDSTSADPIKFKFKVPADDNYVISAQVATFNFGTGSTSGGSASLYINGTQVTGNGGGGGSLFSINYNAGTLTANDEISFEFAGAGNTRNPLKFYFQVYKSGSSAKDLCGGAMEFLFHNVVYSTYDFTQMSPEVISYMYGDKKTLTSGNVGIHTNHYFGTGVTYENGAYKLVNPVLGYQGTPSYSCHSTDANGTCADVYYYVRDYWYITFSGGDTISDFYHNDNESALAGRNQFIYSQYLTSYGNYIEDAPYCNDRSGNLDLFSTYSAYNRVQNGTPSFACSKNDSFTVSNTNGNQALTYPIGSLTVDELLYAGLSQNENNTNNYLNLGVKYWTMTPRNYDKDSNGYVYIVDGNGKIDKGVTPADSATNFSRAVITLKNNVMINSGKGTLNDPYRVAQ